MASHHDWVDEVVARHNATHPFAPENGQALKFKIGDPVVYTNEYEVEFEQTVVGYCTIEQYDSLYALGARYFLDSSSPWMPVAESTLRPR